MGNAHQQDTIKLLRWALDAGADVTEVARKLAIHAHGDQKRRHTDAPYWWHPAEVVGMVQALDWPDKQTRTTAILVAWLHDVVEDTWVTLDDLRAVFSQHPAGEHAVRVVDALTDGQTPKDGNREFRKRQYALQVSMAAHVVPHTVKALDLVSNLRSIALHDRKFARLFVEESEAYRLDRAHPEARDLLDLELAAAKTALGLEIA